MTNRLWILGAPDPEMSAIAQLLDVAEEATVYASVDGTGRRVSAGEAYGDHLTVIPGNGRWHGSDDGDPSSVTVITVECALPPGMEEARHVIIDHHRPGDPGFGRAPSEFWRASAIGQVCKFLGIFPTPAMILTAAADHCLGAAYRGECPGVDPEVLKKFRAEERAKFQGRHVEEVMADIEATMHALRAAPSIELQIRDMRRETPWPELVEAGTIAGVSYIAGPLACPDGRKKIVCSGSADQIRAFMSDFEPSLGLVGIYGDPARGFAGGYLS
jgi:hypothetical protein